MIKFECETCFHEYKVRDDRAGQVLKCKACGEKMRVPSGDDDLMDDIYEAPVRTTRKKKKSGTAKKKKAANSKSPVALIAGVCAFAIAFYVSYTFVGGLFGDKNNAAAIDQELKQLRADSIEKVKAIQNAKSKEEKQKIALSMKTDLDRIKELQKKQQKTVTAKSNAKSSDTATNMKSNSASQQWDSLVNPSGYTADWPESSTLSIDLKGIDDQKIIPHSFSPFIGLRHKGTDVFKIDIWNLATEKKVNQVTMEIKKNWYVFMPKIKLSIDGKYLLMSFKTKDTKIPMLASWDVSTGKKLAEWEVDVAKNNIFSVEICNSTRAFTKTELRDGTNSKSFLKLWDLTSGKLLKEKEIDPYKFDNMKNRISPGGKYLVTLGTELGSVAKELVIYDLESLETIRQTPLLDILKLKEKYFTLLEMEFSPDGKDLGLLLSNSNGTAVWVIDFKTGRGSNGYQANSNISQALSDPIYQGNKLAWAPDSSGWLLYGAWFIDRQRKQLLWTVKPVPHVLMRDEIFLTPHFLIAETATALSDKNGRLLLNRKPFLVSVGIPDKIIAENLAAYESQSNAILGKGQEVSISVNIGDVKFGNVDEVKSIIEDVIKQRLEKEGFKVLPDQSLVLKIDYQEQDGNKLKLTKRGKPTAANPLGRTATGKTLQTTASAFKISWFERQSKKTLWSKEAAVNPRFLILRDATAEAARKQMFGNIQKRFMSEAIPYFIPQDKNLSMLPLEITLPE